MSTHDEPDTALTCVALHPDGCRAISGSAGGTLRLWDPRSSRCIWTVNQAHGARITGAAIDAEAGRILSTSWDKTVKVWDMESGQGLDTLHGHSKVFGISERPYPGEGHRVIWRSFDYRTLRIWSADAATPMRTLVHAKEGFLCFAFFADGRRAISGGWNGEVDLWDLETGACLASTQIHRAEITAAAILGDGRRVITGDTSGGLGVWDIETGAQKLLPQAHEGRVTSLSVTGDERPLAVSGGADKRVRGWDLTHVTCLSQWAAATVVTTSALGRSAPRSVEQGYRLTALATSRTLVAIGDRAGNLSFFEWSP